MKTQIKVYFTLVNLTERIVSFSRVRTHPKPPALLNPSNTSVASGIS